MGRHYRYQLPSWLNKCICVLERAIIPILIFQLIRTLLFLSLIEVVLLSVFIIIFIAFYLEWL